MSARKQRLLEEYLPQCEIRLSPPDGGEREGSDKTTVDIGEIFADKREIKLEIGFGAGEHLATLARRNPQCGFIGCEVYINGVVSLLDKMQQDDLTNIRIFTEDARLLMAALPDCCLSGLYLLFPDPWPKQRHHKRRIVSTEFLQEVSRLLKPEAQLLMASDHADYVSWMLEHLLACPQLEWQAQCADDWRNPPPEWVTTRYESKTRAAGRNPTYIVAKSIVAKSGK